jgi:two-component system sensor histidine kinase HydH
MKMNRSLATGSSIPPGHAGTFVSGAAPSTPSRQAFAVSSPAKAEEMRGQRERRGAWWVGRGAVAIALLAAMSLAATVVLAQRALANAADIVVRGDGDTLITEVIVELWETAPELTSGTLASVIERHSAQGLRYLALLDRQDHHVVAGAGVSEARDPRYLPGEVTRHGRRVRLVALIPPRSETRAANDPQSSPLGPTQLQPYPRPYLIIEFEPPLIERLQRDLRGISLVAFGAALALLAFAIALSRTTTRLWAARRQAEQERRLVELGRASAVIAHELRNPLAALKGHAQLLAEDLAEPSRAKATRVVEGAERLEGLTNVLLDFVRDAPIALRAVTPGEVVERALATLPKERVRVDLSGAPGSLEVDPERASLALSNLIQNAIQATPDGAEPVLVRVTGDSLQGTIEVRDHGPGLAPGAEGEIFEPFVTTKTRGTGLGLSIARRIAEQHHGSLTGATHPQGGAVFRLVLPFVSKPGRPA